MDVEIDILAQRNDEEADDLVSTNEVDDMANEQTWPTEGGLSVGAMVTAPWESFPDAKKDKTPRAIRKVPKGAMRPVGHEDARGSKGEWTDTASDGGEMPHLSFYFARRNGTKEVRPAENGIAVPLPAAEEEMEELTEEITSKAARFEDMDLEEESKQCVPMILPCTHRCSASADQPPYQGSKHGANEKGPCFAHTVPGRDQHFVDVNARIRFQRYHGLGSRRVLRRTGIITCTMTDWLRKWTRFI